MFIDCLQCHLAVCAQKDLPNYGTRDRDFWNLISIREPTRPQIDKNGFLQVHTSLFHDVAGLEQLDPTIRFILPSAGHIREIYNFVDSVSGEPLLIHCWEGRSRSTAIALALIVRGMHMDGFTTDEIISEAPELLLAIRRIAVPNHLVLTLALEHFLEKETADSYVTQLLHHPVLFSNRYPGASPAD
ncbi:MAG: hypothetical protein H7A51_04390 [Akkermansiaceae bacterium]|nr:hypothetical protein [Akkermansiaceae bacterium]